MSVGSGCRGVATLGSGGVILIGRVLGAVGCVCIGRIVIGGVGIVGERGAGCRKGTLGSSGGSLFVGCTLGMVAFGSNREECGMARDTWV